jgi:transcriptional regulator with XRE-family HTH domain
LPQGDAPAVARRRIRLALRKARERSGLTLQEAADGLGASVSKMIRIEQGGVTVSQSDLLALLGLYGIDDKPTADRLVADVRLARSRTSEWADAERWKYLPGGLVELMQFERSATAIRAFQPTLVPGLLQTPEYAEAVFDAYQDQLSADPVEDRAKRTARRRIRVLRAQEIFDRADPPEFYALMDESVLYREVRGTVLGSQLSHLLATRDDHRIHVRIVPFSAPPVLQGPFLLLALDGVDALLYREIYKEDEVVHNEERIQRYRQNFERLWQTSLDEDATARRIAERLRAIGPPG